MNDGLGAPQSLFLLNGDFLAAQVSGFVDRIMTDKDATDARRIARAYPILFGRPPTPDEVEAGIKFLANAKAEVSPRQAWERYAQVLLCTNELIYVE